MILLAATLAFLTTAGAVEPGKPLLGLTVKRQLLDSEHDLRGKQGSTREKTITLRVEITNATSSTVAESELSGDVLVTRAGDEKEKVIKESLGEIKVPAMKPNEKLTLDLGKIRLSEVEFRKRKFEETLEEWQVVCTQGKTEIAKSVSSERYDKLLKEVTPVKPKKEVPAKPFLRPLVR